MLALSLALATVTALRIPGPLSPRNANYRMQVRLDPAQKTVSGAAHITWRNTACTPARELVFHLYMNAFKNEASTFLRESRKKHRRSEFPEHGWGAIDVTRIRLGDRDVTRQLKVNDTLGTLPLPEPLAPGSTVELDVEFATKLPKIFARTGYAGDFFAVTQWFPKLGVYSCENQTSRWRAHQHHLNSEFFADYGVYDVTVDAPQRYWVASTGVFIDESARGGDKRLHFLAEDVHDFAFVAYPDFTVTERDYHDAFGTIKLTVLGIPGRTHVERHLETAAFSLDEYERRLGPYPYRELTIVDVPAGAEGAGGMEYPTLIFTLDAPVPRAIRVPELVTAHELGHQFFYGLVGSDEVEEAWLDEGLTETLTDWALSSAFGQRHSLYSIWGHHLGDTELSRLSYRSRADLDPLETRAFDFVDNATYGAVTYGKTDVVMRTLEGLVGPRRVAQALGHYYETWRFRHPRVDDFIQTMNEGLGEDYTWFWQRALRTTDTIDYEVSHVDTRSVTPPAGLFDADGGARTEVAPHKSDKAPFESEVVIHRRGNFALPIDLCVHFADGSEKWEHWDGGRTDGRSWRRFTYRGDSRFERAKLDPAGKIPLDLTRWNNGLSVKEDPGPRRHLVRLFAHLASSLLSHVGF